MENATARLSKDERRRRKMAYADLIERGEALRVKANLDENVISEVEAMFLESNTLIESASHPDLMMMDATALTIGMSLIKKNLNHVDPNLAPFKTAVLCEKLLAYREDQAGPSRAHEEPDWACLADVAASCFKRTPTFTPMLGQLEKLIPPAEPKPRRCKEKLLLGEKRKPQMVDALDAKSEGMEESIQAILKVIHKEFKRNGGQPICFYSLVIDPSSFSNSVQNIFHFSFLVKDGLVQMKDDPVDNTVKISPINLKDSDIVTQKGSIRMVWSLDAAMWREVIDVYKITKAVITTSAGASKQPSSKRAVGQTHREGTGQSPA